MSLARGRRTAWLVWWLLLLGGGGGGGGGYFPVKDMVETRGMAGSSAIDGGSTTSRPWFGFGLSPVVAAQKQSDQPPHARVHHVQWTVGGVAAYSIESPLRVESGDTVIFSCDNETYANLLYVQDLQQYRECDAGVGSGVSNLITECVLDKKPITLQISMTSSPLSTVVSFVPEQDYYFACFSNNTEDSVFKDVSSGGQCLDGFKMVIHVEALDCVDVHCSECDGSTGLNCTTCNNGFALAKLESGDMNCTACPLHCAECEVVGGGAGEDVESVKLECVKCDEGYVGVLCDKCDDSDGYIETDENTCVGKGTSIPPGGVMDGNSSALATGEIVGIAVGTLAFIAIAAATAVGLVTLLLCKLKGEKKVHPAEKQGGEDDSTGKSESSNKPEIILVHKN